MDLSPASTSRVATSRCDLIALRSGTKAAGATAGVASCGKHRCPTGHPTSPAAETLSRDAQAAAQTLGLELHVLHASSERDFAAVFAALPQLRAGVLVISGTDTFLISRSEQLAALTIRHAVPTIFQFREFIAAGGLMSYGGSITDSYRQAGIYAGRILKGEKPADLPVQQSAKVELMINLKTAKALGLTMPTALLVRADEVIE